MDRDILRGLTRHAPMMDALQTGLKTRVFSGWVKMGVDRIWSLADSNTGRAQSDPRQRDSTRNRRLSKIIDASDQLVRDVNVVNKVEKMAQS